MTIEVPSAPTIQIACQFGIADSDAFSMSFPGGAQCATLKKVPACAIRGRHLLAMAAKRGLAAGRANPPNMLQMLAKRSFRLSGTDIAESLADGVRLNDERARPFINILTACA
jgi:hypothetical protein